MFESRCVCVRGRGGGVYSAVIQTEATPRRAAGGKINTSFIPPLELSLGQVPATCLVPTCNISTGMKWNFKKTVKLVFSQTGPQK